VIFVVISILNKITDSAVPSHDFFLFFTIIDRLFVYNKLTSSIQII